MVCVQTFLMHMVSQVDPDGRPPPSPLGRDSWRLFHFRKRGSNGVLSYLQSSIAPSFIEPSCHLMWVVSVLWAYKECYSECPDLCIFTDLWECCSLLPGPKWVCSSVSYSQRPPQVQAPHRVTLLIGMRRSVGVMSKATVPTR